VSIGQIKDEEITLESIANVMRKELNRRELNTGQPSGDETASWTKTMATGFLDSFVESYPRL